MKFSLSLFLCVSVLWSAVGVFGEHPFQPGREYHYTYSSHSQMMLGMDNMTTIVKFKIRHVNVTSTGLPLLQLILESFVQIYKDSTYFNPLNWDLDQTFLFTMNHDGTINTVHYHPDEVNEVLMLKKVLSSVFTGHDAHSLNPYLDSVHTFTKSETDHMGDGVFQYRAEKHSAGTKITRVHNNTETVDRLHKKVLHKDTDGVIAHVDLEDLVLIGGKSKPHPERVPIPGEVPLHHHEHGKFPKMKVTAKTEVRLTNHRLHFDTPNHQVHELKEDGIVVKQPEPSKIPVSDALEVLDSMLKCSRQAKKMSDKGRMACVRNITMALSRLTDDGLDEVAEKYIVNKTCNTKRCIHDRKVVLDIMSEQDNPHTQRLIVNHVFKVRKPAQLDMERCLFHFIALKKPIPVLVKVVEDLCFGKQFELHGKANFTSTQRKACLTLGALVSWVNATDHVRAGNIVAHYHTWLDKHTKRTTRAIPEMYTGDIEHHVTNMVLLEAVGNAGLEQSIDHIVWYMEPNKWHESWRRSAVRALRFFKCEKSASALLESALHDEHDIVRDDAFKMYSKHPKAFKLTMEQEDIIMRRNVTKEVIQHVRKKRGIAEFLKTISFLIESPSLNWVNRFGSPDFGAEYGLIIRNKMQLELKPLSGFFEIDVLDHAFAKINLGILDTQIVIFEALACFKGSVRYDLNILKDFGINEVSDLANIFDKMLDSVRKPIMAAINGFKDLLSMFKEKGLSGLVNDMIDAVKALPSKLVELYDKLMAYWQRMQNYIGIPWIKTMRAIYRRITWFVDDIKTDVMAFYNAVIDAITIQLPKAAENIWEGIKDIIDAVKKLFDTPGQALQKMFASFLKIKLSVSMLLGAKDRVESNCFFLSETSWDQQTEE